MLILFHFLVEKCRKGGLVLSPKSIDMIMIRNVFQVSRVWMATQFNKIQGNLSSSIPTIFISTISNIFSVKNRQKEQQKMVTMPLFYYGSCKAEKRQFYTCKNWKLWKFIVEVMDERCITRSTVSRQNRNWRENVKWRVFPAVSVNFGYFTLVWHEAYIYSATVKLYSQFPLTLIERSDTR